MNLGLEPEYKQIFKKLNSPQKIQDYLDSLPINFSETHWSPVKVLQKKKAHCFEGAIFAAAVLWYHGHEPLLLDIKTNGEDYDHVVAVFKSRNNWGAISKTNHSVLRWREPVYKNIRELAMSYFHEYFSTSRKKIMKSYSHPFSLKKFGTSWITSENSLEYIAKALDRTKHYPVVRHRILFRKAAKVELHASWMKEW